MIYCEIYWVELEVVQQLEDHRASYFHLSLTSLLVIARKEKETVMRMNQQEYMMIKITESWPSQGQVMNKSWDPSANKSNKVFIS